MEDKKYRVGAEKHPVLKSESFFVPLCVENCTKDDTVQFDKWLSDALLNMFWHHLQLVSSLLSDWQGTKHQPGWLFSFSAAAAHVIAPDRLSHQLAGV